MGKYRVYCSHLPNIDGDILGVPMVSIKVFCDLQLRGFPYLEKLPHYLRISTPGSVIRPPH